MAKLNLTIDTKYLYLFFGAFVVISLIGYGISKEIGETPTVVDKEGTYNFTLDKKVDDYINDNEIDVGKHLEKTLTEEYEKGLDDDILESIAYIDNEIDKLEALVNGCSNYNSDNYIKVNDTILGAVQVAYYDEDWTMVNETIYEEINEDDYKEKLINYLTEDPDELKLNCIQEVKNEWKDNVKPRDDVPTKPKLG